MQDVALLLVKQAELQRSQSGCGVGAQVDQEGVSVPQTLPEQPYWHHLSRNHSPPLLFGQAGALEKLACWLPDWQMEQFWLQENLDWRQQVAFCPLRPEEAALPGLNVRWLQRGRTLRRKQRLRNICLVERPVRRGAARLYLRSGGSAAPCLQEVWRLTQLSQPPQQLPGTTEPHYGRQLLFLLSVHVAVSRAAAAAAAILRGQNINRTAAAAGIAHSMSRDM